jgi:selenocysteine lyase/cysteine desulfurase
VKSREKALGDPDDHSSKTGSCFRVLFTGGTKAAAALLMVGAAYVLLAGLGSEPGATPTEKPSIALLPFADVSRNAEQPYFADGLSEDLLNALGKSPGLRVIGRTSSFSFNGKNEDVRQIAAALGVQHVPFATDANRK